MIFVSPSEPKEALVLLPGSRVSGLPERYGVDYLVAVPGALAGVQRKTGRDLLASLEDGRLSKEVMAMKLLYPALLAVEGPCPPPLSRYTEGQVLRLLWSVRLKGMWVERTPDLAGTALLVREFEGWLSKRSHRSLDTRPKSAARGAWLDRGAREWGVFLLQGFPGVGPELAEAIYDHFGRVPLAWTCSRKELMEVDGIGPKRAKDLMRCLEG